jgi:hypothetical protein
VINTDIFSTSSNLYSDWQSAVCCRVFTPSPTTLCSRRVFSRAYPSLCLLRTCSCFEKLTVLCRWSLMLQLRTSFTVCCKIAKALSSLERLRYSKESTFRTTRTLPFIPLGVFRFLAPMKFVGTFKIHSLARCNGRHLYTACSPSVLGGSLEPWNSGLVWTTQ